MISRIIHVDDLGDPALQPYRTLKRPTEHQQKGIFIAEGDKVVVRLLESPIGVISCLLTPEWLALIRGHLERRIEGIEVFLGNKELLDTIVGVHLHKGIMALARIPIPRPLAELVRVLPRPHFLAAVDGLANAENLGVVVRNCVAGGVQAFLVSKTSADPYLRRAVRNSMGAVFQLPVVYCEDIVATLTALRADNGFRLFAAHPRPGSIPLMEIDFSGNCCVVFGAEGQGIPEGVVAACDAAFTIPMQEGIDSLNVASASAVVVYEALRQRRERGTHHH